MKDILKFFWGALILLHLWGCQSSSEALDPPVLVTQHQSLTMEEIPWIGGPYPIALIEGLSQQLVDEVNCIQPGVLAHFDIAQTSGSLYIAETRMGTDPDSGASVEYPNKVPQYLRPETLAAALGVAELYDDYITIRSAYRDVAMQYYDWHWGQIYNFPAARPGQSRHQGGQAIDVEYYNYWRQKLIDYGWSWPYGEEDAPHFEWVENNEPDLMVESVRAFQRLWNRNHPNDVIEEDGIWGPMTESKMKISPMEGFPYGGCDLDLDGFADQSIGGLDCDDTNPHIHPNAEEICGDGIDQDCSGADLPCDAVDEDADFSDASEDIQDISADLSEDVEETSDLVEDTESSDHMSDMEVTEDTDGQEAGVDTSSEQAEETGESTSDELSSLTQNQSTEDDDCGCQSVHRSTGRFERYWIGFFFIIFILMRKKWMHQL